MKRLLPIFLSFVALLSSSLALSAEPAKAAQPMAVLISADWCMNCKIIKPKLEEAYKGFEGKINFASLDVTNDKTFFKSKQQAFALGVPQLLAGSVSTGWVALFDRQGKQVGRLMQDMSVEDMQKALKALVAK
ncbi:thioredoxin domain-containing protein [Stenotrophobium rhamnosiphilum]|nr:thioredoxin domain-containing protein [Stenotrophobium rhamnosiphilum]